MSARTKAVEYLKHGFNPVPIKEGTKSPKVPELKPYFKKKFTANQLRKLVGSSLGVIAGEISGNLLVLDFDNKKGDIEKTFKQFLKKIKPLTKKYTFPVEKTPSGGFHLFLRCTDPVGGAKKLAQVKVKGKKTAIIETRGEGGYVVVDPTPGYSFNGTPLIETPTISFDEMKKILKSARKFSELNSETKTKTNYDGPTFSDQHFNIVENAMRVTLLAHGWKELDDQHDKKNEYWQRPGKDPNDDSKSAGYNGEVFNVFTTSADPLEDRGYHPIEVIAQLDHKGDTFLAKRSLGLTKRAKNLPQPTNDSESKSTSQPVKISSKLLNKIVKRSEQRQVDAYDHTEIAPFFYIQNHPSIHTGTINLIHGQTGQHKSRISGLVASAIIEKDPNFDPNEFDPYKNLGFQFNTNDHNQDDYLVLYFDTERRTTKKKGIISGQLNVAIQEIRQFANIKKGEPANLHVFTEEDYDPKGDKDKAEGLDFILKITKAFAKQSDKKIVCMIDNLADLVGENDQTIVKQKLNEMNKYVNKYDVTLILTLHENPLKSKQDEDYRKMVGWLGSISARKSSWTLGIKELKPKGNRPIDDHPSTRIFELATTKTRQVPMFRGIYCKTLIVPAKESKNKDQVLVSLCPPNREDMDEFEAPNVKESKVKIPDAFLAVIKKQDEERKHGLKKEFTCEDTYKEVMEIVGSSRKTVGRFIPKILSNQSTYYNEKLIYKEKVVGKKNTWRYTTNPLIKKSKKVK